MRMRKKKNFEPRFDACREYLIEQPEQWRGRYRMLLGVLDALRSEGSLRDDVIGHEGRFCQDTNLRGNTDEGARKSLAQEKSLPFAGLAPSNARVLHLEIGCGRGRFINEHAERNPEAGFVGMERISNVLLLAMEKAKASKRTNLRFLNRDARDVDELFAPGEVDVLYLNFSDPWPKRGYEKNRLTHRSFLEKYQEILKPGGDVFFKTDNGALFAFSVREFEACGFELLTVEEDLYKDGDEVGAARGQVMTEYEERFRSLGQPIHYLHAKNRV